MLNPRDRQAAETKRQRPVERDIVRWWSIDKPAVGYAVAVAATLLCVLVRSALTPLLTDDPPLLLLPAVVAAALVGGAGPGLCATLLATLLGVTLFLDPVGFAVARPADQLRLLLFVVMAVTISLIGEGLWRTIRRYRHAYVTLQDREAQLRAAAERKDALLRMLAHELRAPLAPINNALQLLRLGSGDSAEQHLARDIIERQAAHLDRMIDDLLTAAELNGNNPLLRRRRLDLTALVSQLLTDHQGLFAAARLTLTRQLPDQPLWIEGDPTRLAQMFGYLLANARRFTRAGGQVSVSLRTADGCAEFAVRDNGVGISQELMRELFEPFSQAEQSLERSVGGLGLGLSSARRLAALHGGEVSAQSAGQGRGAVFYIRLPLVEPSSAGKPESATTAAVPTGRVLIIEDNSDTALSLSKLLQRLGYEVRSCGSGTAGLAAARAFRPQVVICDIGLPDLDGFGVARALRADPSFAGLRLVALTGYGSDQDRRQALAAGFDRHLTKPAGLSELRAALAGDIAD